MQCFYEQEAVSVMMFSYLTLSSPLLSSSEVEKVIKVDVKLIVSAPALMPGWAQVVSALGTVMENNVCVCVCIYV